MTNSNNNFKSQIDRFGIYMPDTSTGNPEMDASLASTYKKVADRYLTQEISWNLSRNPDYPFNANVNGNEYKIRLNDFPENVAYTLIVNNTPVISFDDWPSSWKKPSNAKEFFQAAEYETQHRGGIFPSSKKR